MLNNYITRRLFERVSKTLRFRSILLQRNITILTFPPKLFRLTYSPNCTALLILYDLYFDSIYTATSCGYRFPSIFSIFFFCNAVPIDIVYKNEYDMVPSSGSMPNEQNLIFTNVVSLTFSSSKMHSF